MWQLVAILSLIMWGLWGFILKLVSKNVEWYQIYVIGSLITIMISSIAAIIYRDHLLISQRDIFVILASSTAGALGYVFFIMALKDGKASIVVPLTAMYPAITVILSYVILREEITPLQLIGIILAIIATILLST
ncbi:MAG: EamA family transporter [Thermoprotei archaeon]|jgi:transporter family protein